MGASTVNTGMDAKSGPSFVRHPSLPGVEIRVVRDRGARSAPTPPMMTSDLKLGMVVRGANRFRYRGSSWIVPGEGTSRGAG